MPLTRAQRIARYQGWIDDAEAALNELVVGGRPVTVRYGEKELSFGPNDAKQLEAHIRFLTKRIGGRSVLRITPN